MKYFFLNLYHSHRHGKVDLRARRDVRVFEWSSFCVPQAQVVVVSPGMGRCLEKIDDRHLRISTKSDEGLQLQ